MTSRRLHNLQSITVAALLFLLILVGLVTTGAELHDWAWSPQTTADNADVALGHRPQPPPPPRGPMV